MVILAVMATSHGASALPVDLRTFSASPAANIAISADGLTATFSEDIVSSPISLSGNIPFPESAIVVSFQYELSVAAWNEDYFDFFIGDITTPAFSVGGAAGDSLLVFSGVQNVDLRPFGAGALALIFDFGFGFGDLGLDSQLTISNVHTPPIPEPSALLVMSIGLAIVVVAIRRRSLPGRSGGVHPLGEVSNDGGTRQIRASRLLRQPPAPADRGSL
jgi:hypothetical protein